MPITLSNGVLIVNGQNRADTINITSPNNSTIRVTIISPPAPNLTRDFNVSNINSIVLNGNAGNDTLRVLQNIKEMPITIRGGLGNDLIAGSIYADQTFGGDGNDFINAGLGNDYIEGNSGNDILNGQDGQ
jgi:Ca2+-binding RTX toxin-like protein